MSTSEPPSPSYEELAGLVVGLASELERAHARIAQLEARLGRDSTNSSIPPSADSIAAKGQAAGGSFVAGEVQGSQARWAAGPQGVGAGADGDAGSD